MEADFWLQRWKNNEIDFHKNETNPLLIKHIKDLSLNKNQRLFLPLCGKTLDISWLLSQGYQIVGVELSEDAIKQLFQQLDLQAEILSIDNITHYKTKNLDIFVGDIFHLSSNMLGTIDAIYDRAALVALPETLRQQYVSHLMKITNTAPQLLISYAYDQHIMPGPPFSVNATEIKQHYEKYYKITLLESMHLSDKLKGKCQATENVWLLH